MTIKIMRVLIATVMIASVVLPSALAGCACSAGGTWDPYAFLNYNPGQGVSSSAEARSTAVRDDYRSDDFPNGGLLKPMPSVSSSDTVVTISESENSSDGIYIKGALRLSRGALVNQNSTLKSPEEIANALGSIGVTPSDRIVVCGDDLGDAALGFLALKYVGHRDVSLLDGDVERWNSMGLPVQNAPSVREESTYIPDKQNLVATYDYVMSGDAQIVDARPFRDFGLSRIPGAIHIDSERLTDGDRIADNETLMGLFAPLQRDRPVVIYSENPDQASIVWFALQLMGYNAMIYSWGDWVTHMTQNAPGALGRQSTAVTGSETTGSESRYRKLGR